MMSSSSEGKKFFVNPVFDFQPSLEAARVNPYPDPISPHQNTDPSMNNYLPAGHSKWAFLILTICCFVTAFGLIGIFFYFMYGYNYNNRNDNSGI
uniref:Uncharacterized protein n=1 Tax=Acrobeloides nanus TaxID=290746 RepID=A0A914EML1_9BILA